MTNLNRESFVRDSKIVPKIKEQPINIPMKETGNQYRPSVYSAQVNKSKQIDRKLVIVKTSNFSDLKNNANDGTNVYAQISAVKTI